MHHHTLRHGSALVARTRITHLESRVATLETVWAKVFVRGERLIDFLYQASRQNSDNNGTAENTQL